MESKLWVSTIKQALWRHCRPPGGQSGQERTRSYLLNSFYPGQHFRLSIETDACPDSPEWSLQQRVNYGRAAAPQMERV
jgi:hypothetical protein